MTNSSSVTDAPATRVWPLRLVNLAAFVAVIALNGAAATGALSGDSIGVLANRHASLFLPSSYVFGIWSLIYLGLTASLVFQLLPIERSARTVARIGPWWAICAALNVLWIVTFSFSRFGLALVLMLAFLGVLIALTERLRSGPDTPDLAMRAFAIWPHDLYLAWISVALIANTFQYAHVVGFGGFGISELTWSLTMMGVANLLGIVMAWGRGNWTFPFVVAWAIQGIGDRYPDIPEIAAFTTVIVPAGLAAGLGGWALGAWSRRSGSRSKHSASSRPT